MQLISVFENNGKNGRLVVEQIETKLAILHKAKLIFFAKAAGSSLRMLVADAAGLSPEEAIIKYIKNQSPPPARQLSHRQQRGGPRPLPRNI